VDHLQRRVGGRGDEALVAEAEQAGVERVDAVDVLERVDGVDDGLQPDARRERHLDDDPCHPRVVIQLRDRLGEAGLLARRVVTSTSTNEPSIPTSAHAFRIRCR
jgi:hypothetical protein